MRQKQQITNKKAEMWDEFYEKKVREKKSNQSTGQRSMIFPPKLKVG